MTATQGKDRIYNSKRKKYSIMFLLRSFTLRILWRHLFGNDKQVDTNLFSIYTSANHFQSKQYTVNCGEILVKLWGI